MITATLTSIQIALPREHDSPSGPWRTAYYKEPVVGPVFLTTTGLRGDGVGDTKHHGGPENAVCVYPSEHFTAWGAELPHIDFGPGAFAENFTISGLTEETACVDDIFEIGEALIQISKPREPCSSIAKRWEQPDFVKRVHTTGRTGWYMRVLREGHAEAGATMTLVERPRAAQTVAEAYRTRTQG